MNSICGKISSCTIEFFNLYVGNSPSILSEKRQRLVVLILMVMLLVCVALTCVCFVALALPLMSNC